MQTFIFRAVLTIDELFPAEGLVEETSGSPTNGPRAVMVERHRRWSPTQHRRALHLLSRPREQQGASGITTEYRISHRSGNPSSALRDLANPA
jgi:hypothetical protein